MTKIIKLEKTSESCPTQWIFETEDKCEGYIRYRFGYLNIYLSKPDKIMRYDKGDMILWMSIGDDLDGVLSDERVFYALKLMDFTW